MSMDKQNQAEEDKECGSCLWMDKQTWKKTRSKQSSAFYILAILEGSPESAETRPTSNIFGVAGAILPSYVLSMKIVLDVLVCSIPRRRTMARTKTWLETWARAAHRRKKRRHLIIASVKFVLQWMMMKIAVPCSGRLGAISLSRILEVVSFAM